MFVLCAPADKTACDRLTKLVNDRLGFKCEPFDLKAVKKIPSPEAAWYVLILSPDLKALTQELNWVMDHYPDRVLPVLVRECDPGAVHARLEFLCPHDLTTKGKGEERLVRDWQRDIGRAQPNNSILMFLSLKGGVAKTTNLVAVAEFLAEQGNRVLVIDTDHQCGASALLLGEEKLDDLEKRNRTLTDLFWEALNDDFRLDRITSFTSPATSIAGIGRCLSVIPGSLRLEDFWSHYRQTARREAKTGAEAFSFLRNTRSGQFRSWLKSHYDYVLVDCPPAIAWQVRFFLLVSDGYLVPSIPDRLSVRGARYLTRRIRNIGVRIPPIGLLWSMYRVASSVHREYVERIIDGTERLDWESPEAPELPRPFSVNIPHGNAVISSNPGILPKSFAAKYETDFTKRFRQLTQEILVRLKCAVADPQPPAKRPAHDALVPLPVEQ